MNKKIFLSLLIYFTLVSPTIIFIISSNGKSNAALEFSLLSELISIFFYRVPLFLLICFQLKNDAASLYPILPIKKNVINRASFISLVIAFVSLFCLAELVMFFFMIFFDISAPFFKVSNSASSHIVIILSSLSTAYLEEIFFRYYLIKNLIGIIHNQRLQKILSVLISSAMFALCHIWQGAPGIANSFFAGIILNIVFMRFKSFHSIAAAHFLFDVLAFEMVLAN